MLGDVDILGMLAGLVGGSGSAATPPFWRTVSPRLVRCHLEASVKIVELNQGVCKGKEITYFVKIYC